MKNSKNKIIDWLTSCGISNYNINDDLTVDIHEDVDLSNCNLGNIPVQFGKILGDFDCSCNQLTTLRGCPHTVTGIFNCESNVLSTLEFAPNYVGSDYICQYNALTSLKGSPKIVSGGFFCGYNRLTTLKGAPKRVESNFFCSGNDLISLQGSPKFVGGNFDCEYNLLTYLTGTPKVVQGIFKCGNNPIEGLKNFNCNLGQMFVHSYNFEPRKIPLFEEYYDSTGILMITKREIDTILLNDELTNTVLPKEQPKISKPKV